MTCTPTRWAAGRPSCGPCSRRRTRPTTRSERSRLLATRTLGARAAAARDRGQGAAQPAPAKLAATGVTWGIKAPVSMLLAPFLAHACGGGDGAGSGAGAAGAGAGAASAGPAVCGGGDGGLKFVHVVRDGRDIAFSGNQSPVQKVYKASFADAGAHARAWAHFPEHGINLQAMALWADWNGALLRWARRHGAPYAPDTAARYAPTPARGDASGLEYLVLHTEDLVGDVERKYDATPRAAVRRRARSTRPRRASRAAAVRVHGLALGRGRRHARRQGRQGREHARQALRPLAGEGRRQGRAARRRCSARHAPDALRVWVRAAARRRRRARPRLRAPRSRRRPRRRKSTPRVR